MHKALHCSCSQELPTKVCVPAPLFSPTLLIFSPPSLFQMVTRCQFCPPCYAPPLFPSNHGICPLSLLLPSLSCLSLVWMIDVIYWIDPSSSVILYRVGWCGLMCFLTKMIVTCTSSLSLSIWLLHNLFSTPPMMFISLELFVCLYPPLYFNADCCVIL